MDPLIENEIRQKQVESYGRLMAGFSHDMKNHLGIIRESNGLMGDIITMSGLAEDDPLGGRLQKLVSSVDSRIVIAAGMLQDLSSMAHRSDVPCSSFNLNEFLREELTFLDRFARLKQISFSLKTENNLPTIQSDPALLQHIFYRIYMMCLEQMEGGQQVSAATDSDGREWQIQLTVPAQVKLEQNALQSERITETLSKINGGLTSNPEKDGERVYVLSLSPIEL